MKLYLKGHNYKYAVEQMMMMLFPGEKPEYPEGKPAEGGNSLSLSLSKGALWYTATANLNRAGVAYGGRSRCAVSKCTGGVETDRVLQHCLKLAFYKAGVQALGSAPTWGALTGVRPVKLPTKAMSRGATPAQARRELEQEYHVSPRRAALAMDCAKASLSVKNALHPKEVSLYIGIPFCPTRCAYCSFVSADVSRTLKLVDPYLQGLLQEITRTGQVLKQAGLTIKSLYVGGGTPTTLSAQQLDILLSHAKGALPFDRCIEYTVEAGRPDTITLEKLMVLKHHQIERISINPQTLEDHVLEAIGRKHSAEDIVRAYDLARQVGFSCINMDLIAGLPRDSLAGFQRSLNGVLAMAPENITVHTLALKKGSTLMTQGGAIPSGDEVAHMLDYSIDTLSAANFRPYYLYRQKYMSGALENVGWCTPGQESVYNIVMMEELHTVLSVGGGGITKLVDPVKGKIVRLPNPKYPHDYLATLDKVLAQKDDILSFYSDLA